jgi:ABC-2 type transport system permease protein
MKFSWARVGAIIRKELRDYRRNRFISVFTMSAMPLIFIAVPMIQLFSIPATMTGSQLTIRTGVPMLYMLLMPAVMPSALSAYAVVGEREQGTLEPVLTSPVRREEFLIGKALASFAPTLVIAYVLFGIFLTATKLFAHPAVAAAILTAPHLLTQFLFAPLISGWSIWVGIAISTRMTDVRAAQQLAALASLPPMGIVSLISLNVLSASVRLALILAAVLLMIDVWAYRLVSAMFDRERLIAGRR